MTPALRNPAFRIRASVRPANARTRILIACTLNSAGERWVHVGRLQLGQPIASGMPVGPEGELDGELEGGILFDPTTHRTTYVIPDGPQVRRRRLSRSSEHTL